MCLFALCLVVLSCCLGILRICWCFTYLFLVLFSHTLILVHSFIVNSHSGKLSLTCVFRREWRRNTNHVVRLEMSERPSPSLLPATPQYTVTADAALPSLGLLPASAYHGGGGVPSTPPQYHQRLVMLPRDVHIPQHHVHHYQPAPPSQHYQYAHSASAHTVPPVPMHHQQTTSAGDQFTPPQTPPLTSAPHPTGAGISSLHHHTLHTPITGLVSGSSPYRPHVESPAPPHPSSSIPAVHIGDSGGRGGSGGSSQPHLQIPIFGHHHTSHHQTQQPLPLHSIGRAPFVSAGGNHKSRRYRPWSLHPNQAVRAVGRCWSHAIEVWSRLVAWWSDTAGSGGGSGGGGGGGSGSSSGSGGGGGVSSTGGRVIGHARSLSRSLTRRYRSLPDHVRDKFLFLVSTLVGSVLFLVVFELVFEIGAHTLYSPATHIVRPTASIAAATTNTAAASAIVSTASLIATKLGQAAGGHSAAGHAVPPPLPPLSPPPVPVIHSVATIKPSAGSHSVHAHPSGGRFFTVAYIIAYLLSVVCQHSLNRYFVVSPQSTQSQSQSQSQSASSQSLSSASSAPDLTAQIDDDYTDPTDPDSGLLFAGGTTSSGCSGGSVGSGGGGGGMGGMGGGSSYTSSDDAMREYCASLGRSYIVYCSSLLVILMLGSILVSTLHMSARFFAVLSLPVSGLINYWLLRQCGSSTSPGSYRNSNSAPPESIALRTLPASSTASYRHLTHTHSHTASNSTGVGASLLAGPA